MFVKSLKPEDLSSFELSNPDNVGKNPMFNFFIKTAATAMLQGESQKHAMRDVEIMSDTAYRTGLKKGWPHF